MLISFNRILKFGWERFSRDKSSTIGALVVMVIAISIVTGLFLLQGVSNFVTATLLRSVDVSAYFEDSATEDEILQIREQILALPEVGDVEYVSKDEALQRFVQIYRDDAVILDSLEAVGQNPLLASLNIKTNESGQYDELTEFLDQSSFRALIADVDYFDRVSVIQSVESITDGIRAGVVLISIIAGAIAVLVAFNTIRLTIYNSKEEIEVMKLVGASSWFVRGPFLIQGIIVGLIASLLATFLFLGLTFFVAPKLESFVVDFDMFSYYMDNLVFFLLIQAAIGIILGVLSSLIAIHRYLKI